MTKTKPLLSFSEAGIHVSYVKGGKELRTSTGEIVVKLQGIDDLWFTSTEMLILANELHDLATKNLKKDSKR